MNFLMRMYVETDLQPLEICGRLVDPVRVYADYSSEKDECCIETKRQTIWLDAEEGDAFAVWEWEDSGNTYAVVIDDFINSEGEVWVEGYRNGISKMGDYFRHPYLSKGVKQIAENLLARGE